jgi:hypothetical protein
VIRIQADGLVTREGVIENLEASNPQTRDFDLPPQPGPVVGLVLDERGQPLRAAWVSHGRGSAMTRPDGTFLLNGLSEGPIELGIQRGGFASRNLQTAIGAGPTDIGTVSLSVGERVISVENPEQTLDRSSLGATRSVSMALQPLAAAARSHGLTWGDRLESATVRVLVAPASSSLPSVTVERLERFVNGGGHLLLAGEWGGAGGYSPDAMLSLTRRFGVACEPSLLRPTAEDESGAFQTSTIADWFPRSGSGALRFRASGTLFLPPDGSILVRGAAGGYRIASQEVAGWPLVGMMAVGRGRLTLLADSSLLVASGDESSDQANRDFMIDLLRL